MSKPTETELLILNSIIYTSDFVNHGLHMSVYQWACQFDFDTLKKTKPAEMSATDFERVIATIKNNQRVYDQMKIREINNTQFANESGSQRVTTTAITYGEDLIVVYKGTAGDLEWRDNGVGAYSSCTDSQQQKLALAYFDRVQGQIGGKKIYLTGHSKGGNKAQYVGILRGESVERVYSFDGQGFNQAFLLKYKQRVEAYRSKITNISNEYDFVNILLTPIAMDRRYIRSTTNWGLSDKSSVPDARRTKEQGVPTHALEEGEHLQGSNVLSWLKRLGGNMATHKFGAWHSPYSMFRTKADGTLQLNETTPQSQLMQQLGQLLAYYQKYMPEEDWRYLCYSLMSTLQKGDEPYGDDYSAVPEGFVTRMTVLTKGYLSKQKGITPAGMMKPLYVLFGPTGGVSLIAGVIGGVYAGLPAAGYTELPRDFTLSTKQQLLALVQEVEREPFWDITRWDVFYRVEKYLLGGVSFPDQAQDLARYYRKVIDMQNTTAMEIERIFQAVYDTEQRFTDKLQNTHLQAVELQAQLKQLSQRIS